MTDLSEFVEERGHNLDVLDSPFLGAHPQLMLLEEFA
jgi:hypothetical protein